MKVAQPTLFIISFLSIISCTQPKQDIVKLDATTIKATELTHKVQALMDSGEVHGLALAIFNDNRLVYQQAFGYKQWELREPLTDSTNIYGASLSKAVFGALVMQLVEEGKLQLDTPLQHYLNQPIYEHTPLTRWHDNFSDLRSDTLYQKITARMCLNHTSGLPNWRWELQTKHLRF